MKHGWVIIDKPLGASSAKIVARVKRLANSKCGHAGTLDPLASGVLPLALGEATKLTQFLSYADKQYEFEVTWGEERSTDDAEGEVVASSKLQVTREEIEKVMDKFRGEISQTPPQFSAVKIDGQRAYKSAREGKEVEIKPRNLTIHELELTSSAPDKSSFKVTCSKGTYVRSLGRDMGRELGCFGYISSLRRVSHGKFSEKNSISLEKFEELCQKGAEQEVILPPEDVLDDIPELKLSEEEAQKVRNGIVLNIENKNFADHEKVAVFHDNKLLAVAQTSDGKLKTHRVFNL